MKARLLILLAVLGVVLVVVLNREPTPTPADDGENDNGPTSMGSPNSGGLKVPVAETDLPGADPSTKPVLQVSVRPDDTGGQNRVYFTITETHGFFVETFRLRYFYSPSQFQKKDDESEGFMFYVNDYIKANDTLEVYTQLTPVEMKEIGGNMGGPGHWRAEVLEHGRVREKNPDPTWEGYKLKRPTG